MAKAFLRLRAAVWRPTPGSLRFLALLGVIVNAGIVVSGGAVRLTRSGLGCPTWPRCTSDSMLPASSPDHSPLNVAIEFGNRTLTFLVLAVGAAVFVAALRLRPRRRDVLRLATAQPLGVVAQAGLGGITVLTGLHPAIVAAHYMLSAALISAAVALYVRAGEGDQPARPLVGAGLRGLALALAAATVGLLAAGTVVTGTGPHAGDAEARRFGFDIEHVAKIHSSLAWLTVSLTVALLVGSHRAAAPRLVRRRVLEVLAIELAQGLLGYVQYFAGVPAPLVGLHMLGSTLVWIATLRAVYAMRDRGPVPAPDPAAGQPAPAPQPA